MERLAILASGNGSNTENIIKYFKNSKKLQISTVISNNYKANVLIRAASHDIETQVFTKEDMINDKLLNYLKLKKISWIILAGFLLKIPNKMISYYSNKIINIHPSLLPLYGGKGMYGMNVHKKVHQSKDKYSGITIHFVNHEYDKGEIIFQARCLLNSKSSVKDIQKKVHKLEIKFFPLIIEKILTWH